MSGVKPPGKKALGVRGRKCEVGLVELVISHTEIVSSTWDSFSITKTCAQLGLYPQVKGKNRFAVQ